MKPSTFLPLIAGYALNRATGMIIPPDPLDGIDIEKEFELICKKQSNLSASMRRLVVRRYESHGK